MSELIRSLLRLAERLADAAPNEVWTLETADRIGQLLYADDVADVAVSAVVSTQLARWHIRSGEKIARPAEVAGFDI